MAKKIKLTTASGHPVEDNQNSLSAGEKGPLLLQDIHLIEKLAHFDREEIPERIVHAKGAGAFGHFTVTHDITQYTNYIMPFNKYKFSEFNFISTFNLLNLNACK